MSTTPDPHNDLRAIAKALAGEQRGASERGPTRPRRRSSLLIYLAVAAVAAILTHTIRILAECGLGVCPEEETVAAPTPTRDERVAARAAVPVPAATVEVGAADTDLDQRLATTSVKTLLAVERDESPVRSPTPTPMPRRGDAAAIPSLATKGGKRVPAAPPLPAPPPVVASEPAGGDAKREPTPNLSGRWMLTNAIHRTSHPAFRGLRIRFRIELEQHGDKITGRGRKFTIDDRPIPPSQRTPIVLEGTVHGRDVVMRFVEHGSRRDSNGGFRWRLSSDGQSLEGTFDSTAADAAGPSHANREG